MSVYVLYVGNTNKLELESLTNEVTGAFINDASVAMTLKDEAGVEVTGASWPLTLDYVAGSHGLYRCFLPSTLGLVADARYVAEVTASAGGSLVGKWMLDVLAKTRR